MVQHFSAQAHRPGKEYRFHPRRILAESERMSDAKFRRIFRMTRRNFHRLLDWVGPHYPKQGDSSNGLSIKPIERLLVFLYWSGSGASNMHGAYSHAMSEGSIFNCIDSTIKVLHDVIVPHLIKLPNPEQGQREANLFNEKSQFPRIVFSAIDGTHIRVSSILSLIYKSVVFNIPFYL